MTVLLLLSSYETGSRRQRDKVLFKANWSNIVQRENQTLFSGALECVIFFVCIYTYNIEIRYTWKKRLSKSVKGRFFIVNSTHFQNQKGVQCSANECFLRLTISWNSRSLWLQLIFLFGAEQDLTGRDKFASWTLMQGGRSCAKARRAFAEKFGLGRKS